MKLFLDESGTKSQNIPPISDHSLERISFQKNIIYVLLSQLSRVAETQILTIFALVKYRKYRVILYQNPKYRVISCGSKKIISLRGALKVDESTKHFPVVSVNYSSTN